MALDASVGRSFQLSLGEARAEYSNVDDFLSIVPRSGNGAEIVFSCVRQHGLVDFEMRDSVEARAAYITRPGYEMLVGVPCTYAEAHALGKV